MAKNTFFPNRRVDDTQEHDDPLLRQLAADANDDLAAEYRAAKLKASDPSDYLVVEDRAKPSTYHLQVRKSGKPDHRLMGAAWAALHGGYRGDRKSVV